MFYSSDAENPNSTHSFISLHDQDKYSSIRVLDQKHQKLRHSVSESDVFAGFSSEQGQQRNEKTKSLRPYSTVGFGEARLDNDRGKQGNDTTKSLYRCSTAGSGRPNFNNEKWKQSSETTNSFYRCSTIGSGRTTFYDNEENVASGDSLNQSTDPFADILNTVRQSLQKTDIDNILTNSTSTEVAPDGDRVRHETRLFVPGEEQGEIVTVDEEETSPTVSSPRYHTLNDEELDEEIQEENGTRLRKESVVLRHEIIRSYSMTENNALKKEESVRESTVPGDEALRTAHEPSDKIKGYVQLRFDDAGIGHLQGDGEGPSQSSPRQQTLGSISSTSSELVDALQPLPEYQPLYQAATVGKRSTVDVGELHRQAVHVTLPPPSRHTSYTSESHKTGPHRLSSCRVSTTFPIGQRNSEYHASEKPKGSSDPKRPLSPELVFFGDGLFDITEERNEEAVAFSTMVGDLRAGLNGKQYLNLGYLLSPTVTQNTSSLSKNFEEVMLSLEVFIEDRDKPITFECSSHSLVSHVIKKVVETVSKQEISSSSIIESAYTLQVCGYQEYLNPSKMLCEYERVHDCVMARMNIKLSLLDSDRVQRSLARSGNDDIADCEPRIYSQFFERPLDTSVSRQGLNVLREAFDEELKRVLRDADDIDCPRFQPGRLVQSVRAVCTILGQIETEGITNAVYDIKEMKRNYDERCKVSPSFFKVDLKKLRSILQSLYKHVYLLMELYCNTFNTDFGKIRISKRVFNGSIEVTAMSDKFKLYLPAAYRIPPQWKEKFDGFIVEGKIYYGGHLLCTPELSLVGQIYTNFFPQIRWQCWMEFAIAVRMIPRESKLCLTLYGLSTTSKTNTLSTARTPLGWTAVQLFDFNGVLVSESHLFGLWLNQAANPFGTCTSNLIDKRSVILRIDFERNLADIVFPPLTIPLPSKTSSEQDTCSVNEFSQLLNKDMFEELRPNEVSMIWSNRHLASKLPWMLPLVLSSVPDWTYQSLPEIYQLLASWTPLSPVDAMELLKVQFPDQMVRATAVRWMECFSDDELCDYLPQLVQALKYESYHNSSLARFLIERGLRSSRLVHYLFWYLKDNIGDAQFGQRYQVILGGLLSACGSLQRDQFTKQDELVTRITEVAEKVKKSKESSRGVVLHSELTQIPNEFLYRLRLPLNPGVEVVGFLPDECSYFNSNSVPLRLIYKNSDPRGPNIDTIYKVGDDLRQDALTMQLIGIMNKLWLKEGLDLKMVTYRCLPTGPEMGMVEMVEDAQTLREIQTEYGLAGSFKDEPLARWLLKHNPIEKEYGEAVNNFIASCAGYCVATYVIGICDRHNDNIMVKKTGHLFHIDFSKFLGRSQMFGSFRRDRSPFVLTSDMAYVINGGCTPTSRFQDFVDLCCKAFNIIRHHTNLFLNLLSLMLNSGIPYLSETSDLKYVYDVLLPQATDPEATAIFTRQIESSLASRFTQVNFFIHNVAQIRHSIQAKDEESRMPVLSFSPHTYTINTDSRITSARVVDYQKRYIPEKYYVYLINVCRKDQADPTFVFRRYSHFHEFNAKLVDQFPDRFMPKLPGKIYLGRSQIRMVAEKRRQDFDQYLQMIMSMEGVSTSDLLYTFLHTLPVDEVNMKKYAIRLLPEERDTRDRPIGGEVKVSISYTSGQLHIMIMHAKDLLPKSAGGLSDPYVKIYLTPDPTKSTKRKTKVARRTLNPTYNERFHWEIVENELRRRQIRITVWDYDVLTENELMGGVVIDPSDYDFSKQFVGWFTLTDLKRT